MCKIDYQICFIINLNSKQNVSKIIHILINNEYSLKWLFVSYYVE